jgi:hypothetical protein
MAHFAQLNETNEVLNVIVVNNGEAPNEDAGVKFCKSLFGDATIWKQTSFNSRGGIHFNADGSPSGKPALRYNFASRGYKYDLAIDSFYDPNPPLIDTNWIFNPVSQAWENNMKVIPV